MRFKDSVMSLISQFTGQKNTLTIPKVFITYAGDLNTALFLSQLLYWADRTNNKEGYVYKTYMEWEEEICLSKYQVSRAVNVLQKKGVLETKVKKANGNPTVHYRIKQDEFIQSFVEFIDFGKLSFLTNESGETSQSLTEITTEITTKKKEEEEVQQFLASPFKFYEENGYGTLSPLISEDISYWIDGPFFQEPELIIIQAMKEGVLNNARRWNYVSKVLIDWNNRGLKTLDQVLAAKKEHEAKKTNKPTAKPIPTNNADETRDYLEERRKKLNQVRERA